MKKTRDSVETVFNVLAGFSFADPGIAFIERIENQL
mgnify:CR=1 FL=1